MPQSRPLGTNTVTFTVALLLPVPPVFAGYSMPAPGQLGLRGTGTPGWTYTLLTSTNLVNWVDHTNLLADPNGLIDCQMEIETNTPACFYRLRRP